MANTFVSFTSVDSVGIMDESAGVHTGSSSTAGDKIEMRCDTTMTRFQILRAIKRFQRHFRNNGLLATPGTDGGVT